MSTPESRAVELAQNATEFFQKGETAAAQRAIKEAITLCPTNETVIATVAKLRQKGHGDQLVSLCKSWAEKPSDPSAEKTAQEALKLLASQPISDDVAADALKHLLEYGEESDTIDQLTHNLLRVRGARLVLAHEISAQPTALFRRLFARGDDTILALSDVLRDISLWPVPDVRVSAVRDVFQLALSMSLEAGLEHPERSMSLIAQLLVCEAQNLTGLMDADGFRVLLDSLDVREPTSLRREAAIAVATLIEHSPESAHALISEYISPRVETPTTNTLIRAFSAAAAVFPMATLPAVALFLSDGFMPKFVALVKSKNSTTLTTVALELLSAACVDKNCRDSINFHCRSWLVERAAAPEKPSIGVLSALVLTKLNCSQNTSGKSSPTESQQTKVEKVPDFLPLFRDTIVSGKDPKLVTLAVEGLAYLTLDPTVKEHVAYDAPLLNQLSSTLTADHRFRPDRETDEHGVRHGTLGASPAFGVLTILVNITTFAPLLTEQERKIKEVQDYANSNRPSPSSALEEDSYVSGRCEAVVRADTVSSFATLLRTFKSPSLHFLRLIALTILFLAKVHKTRGVLAQQGAVKHLLYIYDTVSKQPDGAEDRGIRAAISYVSALGMARIMISVNPAVIFAGTSNAVIGVIPPLITLLGREETPTPEPSAPRALAMFESLLALTNVASVGQHACAAITKRALLCLDDILFSNRALIQRAATELCCNICTCPEGVAAFTNQSDSASKVRFDLLVALSDADDLATRRASGGALAILTAYPEGIMALLNRKGGVERVLALCTEEDYPDVVIRALTVVSNMLTTEDEALRQKAVTALKGVPTAKATLEKAKLTEGAEDMVGELTEGISKL